MKDIKQRAREMFDGRFNKLHDPENIIVEPFKSFIDEIIDMAQEERDKEWVNVLNQVERAETAIYIMSESLTENK